MMDIKQDFFSLLGVPVSFEVDLALLSKHYRELQKTLHPDRFAHQSERDQRLSVQYTAHLNEAYNTLKSPLERSQYLMSLKGIDVVSETSVKLDPAFLFEQMELREHLADLSQKSDPFDELEELSDKVAAMIAAVQSEFVEYYNAATAESLDKAAGEVRKLQFFYKLQSEIESTESELDS